MSSIIYTIGQINLTPHKSFPAPPRVGILWGILYTQSWAGSRINCSVCV